MNEYQNPLLRREGESELSHHRRLVYGKLVDKTLADYDYAELSSHVYGEELSGDSVRKMMYGTKRTLDLLDAERLAIEASRSPGSDIDAQILELRKERQKFYDQRREYNKLVSEDARIEHLFDSLAKSAEQLPETIGCLFDGSFYIPRVDGDSEAVLVFSDWHYGMQTNNMFNTYNTDICKERVQRVVDAAIQRITLHGCRKLHLVVLGDLLHGGIHCSARVASDELVCDQLMQVSEILAQAIMVLSAYVERTIVYITYGNHARTIQSKHDSIHRDNMERIVPWWLAQRLQRHQNICIAPASENEFLFIDACGHDICATHGDLDSVKCAPRLLTTVFQKKYGKDIEYILLGDKHHRESFNELGVTATICGSLCGTDDYANEKRLYSHPEQLLLIVHPEYGVDAEYRLKC